MNVCYVVSLVLTGPRADVLEAVDNVVMSVECSALDTVEIVIRNEGDLDDE